MTNQELKQLCERVQKSLMSDACRSDIADELATECLRLLAENTAMRGEIIALRRVITALCGDRKTRDMADKALEKYRREALSQLPPEAVK